MTGRPGADRSRAAGPDRLARAAHWHAARGLAVFPLGAGSKKPAIADWPRAATTDPDQITQWWTEAAYNLLTGLCGDTPMWNEGRGLFGL